MANVNAYPIADVTQMAEATGFTLEEIQGTFWSDTLLQSKMSEFYAGTLDIIVNPGQGTAAGAPGTIRTLAFNLDILAQDIENATRRVLQPLGTIFALSPLIIAGGITLAVLLLMRKAK